MTYQVHEIDNHEQLIKIEWQTLSEDRYNQTLATGRRVEALMLFWQEYYMSMGGHYVITPWGEDIISHFTSTSISGLLYVLWSSIQQATGPVIIW